MGLRDDVQRARQEVLRKDAEAAEAKAKAEQEKLEANVAPARAALPGLMAEWAQAMGLEHVPDVHITEVFYGGNAFGSMERRTQRISFDFEEDGLEFIGQVEIIGADPLQDPDGEDDPPVLEINLRPASEDAWPGRIIRSVEDLARALMQLEEQDKSDDADTDES